MLDIAAVSGLSVAIGLWAAYALGLNLGLGPLSQHMIDHIALLVVAAPVAAWLLRTKLPAVSRRGFVLIVALHIGLIWTWHLPPVLHAAQGGHTLHVAMCVSLFAVGVAFWHAIIGLGRDRWQAVAALLLTGKLFCLFAALLVFSPRVLYAGLAHAHHADPGAMTGIADQQMAGVIMLAICPLAYVATGIFIAARWILDIERASPQPALRAASLRSGN
ncbi:cytochrome C oxidase assembly protein [Hyphomicrobium nitrativorans NL23]|uniref:Cytochrome C oxidase assembly protein n=2 Tax=Hyphomicrobium TaxID=81 RepID=V5SFE4_9HYPH|nr:cytochrome C oxidase assembly protein [Hyphomicrobium nitrativorans NL23]